ncbi:hypothetical protein FA10DRAFT_55830 [Acaromyces ingoldii]|uniref:Zn(2)-C6 fungal-type domain-containing protein n=1 Tax=Acaromyces ingoldii TaxID=215250 RepID=A0A316Y9Q2_9BASI|nr:hypothetical protein FA10DRAFT_55830 [Acaromyces ingoldii]PWN86497.1 hypothetical protein FA10DRAFT_55830 [Acaromyces ingoldii]
MGKPRRTYSCLRCQKDKAKCDRKLPCGRCQRKRTGDECTYSSHLTLQHDQTSQKGASGRRDDVLRSKRGAIGEKSVPTASSISERATVGQTARLMTLGHPRRREKMAVRQGYGGRDAREWSPDPFHTEELEPMVLLNMPTSQSGVLTLPSIADPSRRTGGDARLIGHLRLPFVPTKLAWHFLEDFLDLIHPMLPILRPYRLRSALVEYCGASRGDIKISKADLVYILVVLAVGAGAHASALQGPESSSRREAEARAYEVRLSSATADHHESQMWRQSSLCTEKAADLYTVARFLVVDLENEEPCIEAVRCYRLLASYNLSQNLWLAFSFGLKAIMISMALKLHLISPTATGLEGEARDLWVSCATIDKLSLFGDLAILCTDN